MDQFLDLLKSYGFLAVFVWSCVETDLIFLVIGAFAHAGYLHLASSFPAACAGALLHDLVVFWLVHHRAEWIRSKSAYQKMGPKIERLAAKVGFWELALCRPLYGTRYPSLIFWGLQKLSYPRFWLADASGLLPWAALLTSLGYAFGDHLPELQNRVLRSQQWLLGAVLLLLLAWGAQRALRKKALASARHRPPLPQDAP
ncbi:MAG: hypothetical protein RLZZ142_463 [Verrucomicrobiota bacterium]|jgi:membrane protein DedA with SNARE-associated domain